MWEWGFESRPHVAQAGFEHAICLRMILSPLFSSDHLPNDGTTGIAISRLSSVLFVCTCLFFEDGREIACVMV